MFQFAEIGYYGNKLSLKHTMARIKRKTNQTHTRENCCVKLCKLKPFKDIF